MRKSHKTKVLIRKKYDELVENYHELQQVYSDKQLALHERKVKLKELNSFIDILKQQEKLAVKCDEKIFLSKNSQNT